MKKSLNIDEQLTMATLMGEYQNIHEEINRVESQLKQLTQLQEILTSSLDKTRNDEKEFGVYLKQKYGPGKLDTITLEYITE
jgi:hypothetical protein